MNTPLVSILIPCYNAERWLKQTLFSALTQTWENVEVVVVDDGSTDDSMAVAKEFADKRLRIVGQSNRGAAAARNVALREASGAFIQFLDADDLLAEDKIDIQMKRLATEGIDCVASGGWARFRASKEEAVFEPQPNWRDLSGVEFQQLHFEEAWMMHPGAWLTPRRLADAAGPWDESLTLNDDGEYFSRVMLAATKIAFCGEARSYYRSAIAGGSLSARRDRRSLESLFRSAELMSKHLQAADASGRTQKACADLWQRAAYELYPGAPDLSRSAEAISARMGGSRRPLPGSGSFQLASKFFGWRLAKRLAGPF